MVNQLSLVLFGKCELGLLFALGGKPVEFSLASVSWYFGGNPVESSFALVSVSRCCSLLWVVNQLSLVLFGKCEQGLFLALGGKPVEFCLASVSRYCSLL